MRARRRCERPHPPPPATSPAHLPFPNPAAHDSLELDVECTGPDGRRIAIPAFWAGGRTWRVRFASPRVGDYMLETRCTDPGEKHLHKQIARVSVIPYAGDNPLLGHGPIEARKGERFFRHADRTPFLWLADTWWMGLC